MARILYVASHGTDNPTKAGLAFIGANGAREAGHEAAVVLIGDGTYLIKDTIASATTPVGWPSVAELIKTAVERGVSIHV